MSKSIATTTYTRAVNLMYKSTDGIEELVDDEVGSSKSGELPKITKSGTKQRKSIVIQRTLYN